MSDNTFRPRRARRPLRRWRPAHEIVLREGTPADIEEIVDEVLLCEAWPDLVLPRSLRSAWAPLIRSGHDTAALPTAS